MMNKNFDSFLSFILEKEGLYSHDPTDRGGETMRGISRVHHPQWSGWAKVDRMKEQCIPFTAATIEAEMGRQIYAFYRNLYWNNLRCDELPSGLDMFVADSAIQHGANASIRWLQEALRLKVDGLMSPVVVSATFKQDATTIIWMMAARRMAYYISIKDNASRLKFCNGWANRHHQALKIALGGR